MNKINHIKALEFIKNGHSIINYDIEITEQKVEALDALLLGENNVIIPSSLIYYNDEEIDYSDNPDITDVDFKHGLLTQSINIRLKTRADINDWIKSSKINLDLLASKLIEDFYDNMQVVKTD